MNNFILKDEKQTNLL